MGYPISKIFKILSSGSKTAGMNSIQRRLYSNTTVRTIGKFTGKNLRIKKRIDSREAQKTVGIFF